MATIEPIRATRVFQTGVTTSTNLTMPTRAQDGVPADYVMVITSMQMYGIGGGGAGQYTAEVRTASGADFHCGVALTLPTSTASHVTAAFPGGVPCNTQNALTSSRASIRSHSAPTDALLHVTGSGTAASSLRTIVHYTWIAPSEFGI